MEKHFSKITEQDSLYTDIDKMDVREILTNINNEDQKVALAVRNIIPEIEKLVSAIVPRMKEGGRLFYIGAGTSGRLGVLDASEIPPTFGMPSSLVIGIIAGGDLALKKAMENVEDDPLRGWKDLLKYNINSNDSLVGIAASGTTPYVIGALKKAQENNILTAAISSNPCSPLSRVADYSLEMVVGPEFITGSSRMKSGTGQKMILNMITTSVMIKLGRVKGNKMINMQLNNQKLRERGVHMIMEELSLSFEEASNLLERYGSVKLACEEYKKQI